jgi:FkbM family methyltransferase
LINIIKIIIKKLLPKIIRSKIEKNLKFFYSANSLDKKMLKYINYNNGTYIEVGANDGILQSNTYFYEKKKNWSGLLIEPIYKKFLQLKKNRSGKNFFANYALVSFNYKKKKIFLEYSDLMTTTISKKNEIDINNNITTGKKHLNIYEKEKIFSAKTTTLNSLLKKNNMPEVIDFFSLDVEGYELEVLKGINFNIYKFRYILVECINNSKKIKNFLQINNYKFVEKLSDIDYLFRNVKI